MPLDQDTWLRVGALCVLLASAETLHGIARTVLIAPMLGKARALQISAMTGTLLAFGICWWQVPALHLKGMTAHLVLGMVLAAFMAAFDIGMSRLLLRKSWPKIRRDFCPASGNHLLYGLIALCMIPWLIAWAKGMP